MSPVDRTSFPSHGETQEAAIVPWICVSFFIFAALWSHASLTSEVSLVVVFVSALFSSVAGFAFSPLAGSVLFHVEPDPVPIVKIILVASIAQQSYCIWRLRGHIKSFEFMPYLIGSLSTLPLGLLLLLRTNATIYLPILGGLLAAYGMFAVVRPIIRAGGNPLIGRIAMGALGGLTGGLAAFPAAFVTIWCQAQGFGKERQRSIVQPFILINQLWMYIFYDDVCIPLENIVGEVNGGWKVLTGALAFERGLVGGGIVLKVAHAFEQLRKHLIATQGDRPAPCSDPLVRDRIAVLASEIEVGRQLMMHCAELASDGITPPEYGAISKVFSSELMERFGEAALAILGMRAALSEQMPGAIDNGRFEQNLRHSLMWVISIGTNEIQRSLIAQRALGLPR
jgi:hypothetical protein